MGRAINQVGEHMVGALFVHFCLLDCGDVFSNAIFLYEGFILVGATLWRASVKHIARWRRDVWLYLGRGLYLGRCRLVLFDLGENLKCVWGHIFVVSISIGCVMICGVDGRVCWSLIRWVKVSWGLVEL